jgi:hypothetical protein
MTDQKLRDLLESGYEFMLADEKRRKALKARPQR